MERVSNVNECILRRMGQKRGNPKESKTGEVFLPRLCRLSVWWRHHIVKHLHMQSGMRHTDIFLRVVAYNAPVMRSQGQGFVQVTKNDICDWGKRKHFGSLTLGSMILRYRTWIPLVVKYGISNLTLMGRLLLFNCPAPPILPPNPPVIPPPCSSSPFTEGRPNSARIKNSFPPPNCLIFQIIADFSGA